VDLLQNHPVLWMSVAAVLGLQFGSFLNVVVWRLPVMMQREWEAEVAEANGPSPELATFNLATPSSHCTSCMTPLRARDLVPVLSYLWLKGRCGHCGAHVSIRYPLVELAVAAFPDASDIYERNIQTLRSLGHEGWKRLWTDPAE